MFICVSNMNRSNIIEIFLLIGIIYSASCDISDETSDEIPISSLELTDKHDLKTPILNEGENSDLITERIEVMDGKEIALLEQDDDDKNSTQTSDIEAVTTGETKSEATSKTSNSSDVATETIVTSSESSANTTEIQSEATTETENNVTVSDMINSTIDANSTVTPETSTGMKSSTDDLKNSTEVTETYSNETSSEVNQNTTETIISESTTGDIESRNTTDGFENGTVVTDVVSSVSAIKTSESETSSSTAISATAEKSEATTQEKKTDITGDQQSSGSSSSISTSFTSNTGSSSIKENTESSTQMVKTTVTDNDKEVVPDKKTLAATKLSTVISSVSLACTGLLVIGLIGYIGYSYRKRMRRNTEDQINLLP